MRRRIPVPNPETQGGEETQRVVILHMKSSLVYCIDRYAQAAGCYRTDVIRKACAEFLERLPDGKGFAKPSQFQTPERHLPQEETPEPTRLEPFSPAPLGDYAE